MWVASATFEARPASPKAMKQVTLHIKEGRFRFFMELIKSLDFVTVVETGDSKEEGYEEEEQEEGTPHGPVKAVDRPK